MCRPSASGGGYHDSRLLFRQLLCMPNCDKFLKARCLASFEHAAVGTDAYSQPGAAVLALSGTKHFAEHSKGNVEAQHFPDLWA